MSEAEKFFAKTEPELNTGCWLWTMGTAAGGYGHARFSGSGKNGWRTHRIAWYLTHGPIPAGQSVCHRCDTPACCNPDHLFLGTHQENMTDMSVKGRHVSLRGVANPRAVLNPEKVVAIRAAVARGVSKGLLARTYGVSWPVIDRAASGRTWAHVS